MVVGGNATAPHEFPWAVGLLYDGRFICGGTIISERTILTAAHCVSSGGEGLPATMYTVLVGAHKRSSSGKTFQVQNIIWNRKYSEFSLQNDIALLILETPIDFEEKELKGKARPICLPTKSVSSYAGKMATVVGWGTTSEGGNSLPDELQGVGVPVISNWRCLLAYPLPNFPIRGGQICAGFPDGGKDSCQGDSGGSLAAPSIEDGSRWIQLGVTSWGMGCARRGKPGVYTRVSSQLDWIQANAK